MRWRVDTAADGRGPAGVSSNRITILLITELGAVYGDAPHSLLVAPCRSEPAPCRSEPAPCRSVSEEQRRAAKKSGEERRLQARHLLSQCMAVRAAPGDRFVGSR